MIGSTPIASSTLSIQNTSGGGDSLKAYYLSIPLRRHRHPFSPLRSHNFTAEDFDNLIAEEEKEEEKEKERKEKMTFIQERTSTPMPRVKSPLIKIPSEGRNHSWRHSYEVII